VKHEQIVFDLLALIHVSGEKFQVKDSSIVLDRENLVFISHRWLTIAHPDDDRNSKLLCLQNILSANDNWQYLWIDYLCVPQDSRDQQTKAINSLPYYVKCCSAMITLCLNEGGYKVYCSRGWCRLEQLSSVVPLFGEEFDEDNNSIKVPWKTNLFIVKNEEGTLIQSPFSYDGLNPLHGSFFDDFSDLPIQEKDRSRVALCVEAICEYLMAPGTDEKLRCLAIGILPSAREQLRKIRTSELHRLQEQEVLATISQAFSVLDPNAPDVFPELQKVPKSWQITDEAGLTTVINLSKYSLKGHLLVDIGKFRSLQQLDLSNNRFTGPVPPALGKLTALRLLDLGGNAFTGQLPREIGKLHKLQILILNSNQFEGHLGHDIGELSSLELLNLSGNRFSGHIPFQIGYLFSLKFLNLSQNFFTGKVPRSLENLKLLFEANFSENPGLEGTLPSNLLVKELSLNIQGTNIHCPISLDVPQFPLLVLPRSSLLKMTRLLSYNEAGVKCRDGKCDPTKNRRTNGMLWCLFHSMRGLFCSRHGSELVKRSEMVYISHKWFSSTHPDDDENHKLLGLQQLARAHKEWHFFWIDYVCIPQTYRLENERALYSNSHFVKCCANFVILCGETGKMTLDVWKSRGYCRFELLSSYTPLSHRNKNNIEVIWENRQLVANTNLNTIEELDPFPAQDLNPLLGLFSDDADNSIAREHKHRTKVAKCVIAICEYMQASTEEKLKVLANELLPLAKEQAQASEQANHAADKRLFNSERKKLNSTI